MPIFKLKGHPPKTGAVPLSEAAREFGVSPRTMRGWHKDGLLNDDAMWRFGERGHWRVDLAEAKRQRGKV